MSGNAGELSLLVATLSAAGALFCSALAGKTDNKQMLIWSRRLMYVFGLAVAAGSWVLLSALINSDFNYAYVASYTERALPMGYKVAAFWAGQEGSLMLWALLLAGMSAVAVFGYRKRETVEQAAMICFLALVCGFFAMLMLFVKEANPFTLLPGEAVDGHGLNPLLQDPYMIAHPPLLFVGYAAYTIPWAMLMGALIAGRKDNLWIGATRLWLMVSWLFLTVGIILGAKWAYIELGWGGYWAWDPVENASLLPWLTGTALLHSVMVQQHRGMFKIWNAVLIAVTFLLCILGTYLTRSGVVQSVHSFGESPIGTFFLVFLGFCVLISIGVIVWRRDLLKSEDVVQGIFTREGAFLAVNVLLVLITLTTLIGTIFPLISGVVMPEPVSVGETFYNKVVIPLGLALLAVMSVGPLLSYGKGTNKVLVLSLFVPAITAVLALVVVQALAEKIVMLLLIVTPIAVIATTMIALSAIVSVCVGIAKAVKQRRRIEDEGPLTATLQVIDGNHRRYGGQLVHMGMIMFMVGVAGSSLFGVTETFKLTPGESAGISGYTVTFNGLHQNRYTNYTAVEAHVNLTRLGGDEVKTLLPQMRFYDKSEQPSSQVALNSSLKRDVYITLAGWDDDGQLVAFQAIINPLIAWIWIGGIVMTFGAVFCLMPKLIRQASPTPAHVPSNGKSVKLKADTVHLTLAGEGRCMSDTSADTTTSALKPELTK